MFKSFLHWRIRAFERRYDYDASYLHEITDVDRTGLIKFQCLGKVGQHTGGLPLDALFAARLAAALHEDCGPCVQVVVNIALEAGVNADDLRALASGDVDAATASAALAFRFAEAVLTSSRELESLRAEAIRQLGPRAPFCLALALSVARSYPLLKRAMGHAHTCLQLEVGGTRIATSQ